MTETLAAGTVELAIRQGVATVIFNRPQARNAMTWGMYQQLSRHCEAFKADTSVRAVVFRGAGGQAFVAGTDIEQFTAFSTGEDGVAYEAQIEACIDLLCALPMPTVAADLKKKINRPVSDLPLADEAEASLMLKVSATATTSEGIPSAAAAGHMIAASLTATIQNQKDAPPCPKCGHIAVRNGACYKCLNCGESLGCS